MHSGKLVPMNTHTLVCQDDDKHTLDCTEMVIESISTLKSDTENTSYTAFYSSCRKLVCILGTASVRRAANLPPATSRASSKQSWPSALKAIYEIWIIPSWGRKCWGILCWMCVIHVTPEWARDRSDCLWDGAGMWKHHSSNTLVCRMLHTHVDTCARSNSEKKRPQTSNCVKTVREKRSEILSTEKKHHKCQSLQLVSETDTKGVLSDVESGQL